MDAVNYLKLDLKLFLSNGRYYIIFPFVVILFMVMNSPAFALNYLFFFAIIVSTTPFSLEASDRCKLFYYILPGSRKSMVLGRYLFLLVVVLTLSAAELICSAWFLSGNKMTDTDLLALAVSAFVGILLCCIQYPVFYKLGYEKGKLASNVLFLVPAFVTFSIPAIITGISSEIDLSGLLTWLGTHQMNLICCVLLFLSAVFVLSWRLSARVCESKEL